jgi:hypothetical protein
MRPFFARGGSRSSRLSEGQCRSSRVARLFGVVAIGFTALGCVGSVGSGETDIDDPNKNPQNPECTADTALVVPMQRLNIAQFRQVVTELFGEGIVFDDAYPAPLSVEPYSTYSALNPIADAQVKPIMETVEAVAMQVADRVPACTGDEAVCARTYLTDIATRALRRAASTEELAILESLYSGSRTDMDYAESVAVAIAGLLQMPAFLYVLENAPLSTKEVSTLDGQEIAQRMALVYWNGLPDDALLELAKNGALDDADTRQSEARRMLKDPRAEAMIAGFMREWMTVKGFKATIHAPELQDALERELELNLADALAADDGLRKLLTSPRTHVNSVLEAFYGLPQVSTGPDDWREVDLDPAQRVGILTHPLLLAKFAHGEAPSDILRGKFIRLNILCGDIQPPPPGVQDQQAEISAPDATIREQAQARLDHETCGGCHMQMDPIGFGFSAFDGAGKYLGANVDQKGEIVAPSENAGSFNGVRELGERIADSAEAQSCFARQWMRYALGKKESRAESCSAEAISESLASQSLNEVFASAAGTRAFVVRAPEGE